MSNTSRLLNITKRIQKIYGKLYAIEKNSVIDDDYISRILNIGDTNVSEEYFDLLGLLEILLKKEDEIYGNLTYNEIYFLTEYLLLAQKNSKKNDKKELDSFNELATNVDLMYTRMTIRIDIYLKMRGIGDINWYQKLHRGLYLNENNDPSKESDFYYFLITSSCNIINYIKSIAYDINVDEITLLNKYINSFVDPFAESTLVKNNFKINYDYDYILKIADYNNEFMTYKEASRVYFQNKLRSFVIDVMWGKITDIDDSFIENLTSLESFLEIINNDVRESIYMMSVDLYRMSGNTPNICTENFFDLFKDEELDNNQEYKIEY